MVPTYPKCHSHAQLTPTITNEPKTFRVCTTVWRIQLRRQPSSPAWYTSHHPRKSKCERHVGIPWSKWLVSRSLAEPLLMPSRLSHQKRGEWDSDCVDFPPHNTPLPYKSSAKNTIIAARELSYSLKNPSPQAQFSNIRNSQLVAIEQLSNIFTKADDNRKTTADPPHQQAEQTATSIFQKLQSGRT